MRISKFVLAMAFATAALAFHSPVHAQLFQPTGSVLGNVDKVSQMRPHVVLGYLAECANVTDVDNVFDVMFPENSDCLFDNYVSIQFPGPTFGDMCSPPNVSMDNITANLSAAALQCPDDFDDFIETASVLVMKVYAEESCWLDLCEQDGIALDIESQYIEQCSGVELPYPAESNFGMILSDDETEDAILTCMLHFVMNAPASQFGLDEPPLQCWPPGFDDIGAVCLNNLATAAFATCTNNTFFDTMGLMPKDFMMDFSMDYSMSMPNDYDDDDDDEDDGTDHLTLLERFCAILDGLTTDKGLECLGVICSFSSSPSPSAAPSTVLSTSMPSSISAAPSTALSTSMPSMLSTSMPSMIPSDSPSLSPSTEPSPMPSALPSMAPSVMPSTAPSKSPSDSPSVSPTVSPSAFPTLNDIQKVVEVEIVAGFSLDTSTTDEPDLETLESGIMDLLETADLSINATILSTGSLRRRLQNDIPVEFSVEAFKECYLSDCTVLATNLIAALNNTLASSVSEGYMTAAIRQAAATRNITVLTTANVITTSYQFVSSEYELKDPVIITNPDPVQSSAALVSTMLSLSLLTCALMFSG